MLAALPARKTHGRERLVTVRSYAPGRCPANDQAAPEGSFTPGGGGPVQGNTGGADQPATPLKSIVLGEKRASVKSTLPLVSPAFLKSTVPPANPVLMKLAEAQLPIPSQDAKHSD